MNNIIEEIKQVMLDKNINQSQLASKLNISKARISQILNSDGNLTIKLLARISEALDCNIKLDIKDAEKLVNNQTYEPAKRIFPIPSYTEQCKRGYLEQSVLWNDYYNNLVENGLGLSKEEMIDQLTNGHPVMRKHDEQIDEFIFQKRKAELEHEAITQMVENSKKALEEMELDAK